MFAQCYVHQQPFVMAASHQHHEVPQAAGGADGQENLVSVCSNCHNVLHRVAENVMRGKAGTANDIATSYAPSPAMRSRLMELARCVAEHMVAKNEGDIEGPDEVSIQVILPKEAYRRLKLAASEHRVNGRKIGASRYVQSLILRDLKRRGWWPPQ